VTRIAL